MNSDFVGLTVASRHARRAGLINHAMTKKLERLDSAFSVVRHLSGPKVNSFLMELEGQIQEVPLHVALAPSSSDEGSSPSADSDFSGDHVPLRVLHVHIGECDASTQTMLTMNNTVVTASAEELVHASVEIAGRALADRVACAAQRIQTALAEVPACCTDECLPAAFLSGIDNSAAPSTLVSGVASNFNSIFLENRLAALRRDIKVMCQSVTCVTPPPVLPRFDGGCVVEMQSLDVEVDDPAVFQFDVEVCRRAQVAATVLATTWSDFEKNIAVLARMQHEDEKAGDEWWSVELQIAEDIATEVEVLLPAAASGIIAHEALIASLVVRTRGCLEEGAKDYIDELGIQIRNGKVVLFEWALAKALHGVGLD
jgi:hypothetical protein